MPCWLSWENLFDMEATNSTLKNGTVLLTPAFSIVISKHLISSVEGICAFFDATSVSIDRMKKIFGEWSYCYSEVQGYWQLHTWPDHDSLQESSRQWPLVSSQRWIQIPFLWYLMHLLLYLEHFKPLLRNSNGCKRTWKGVKMSVTFARETHWN